jgi:hypothetical protein
MKDTETMKTVLIIAVAIAVAIPAYAKDAAKSHHHHRAAPVFNMRGCLEAAAHVYDSLEEQKAVCLDMKVGA